MLAHLWSYGFRRCFHFNWPNLRIGVRDVYQAIFVATAPDRLVQYVIAAFEIISSISRSLKLNWA